MHNLSAALACLQPEGPGAAASIDLDAARATLSAAQQQDLEAMRRAHQARMDHIYGLGTARQVGRLCSGFGARARP